MIRQSTDSRSSATGLSLIFLLSCVMTATACGGGTPTQPIHPTPVEPTPTPAPLVTAPEPDTPVDDQQVAALRPELRVRNATSDQQGERTYEFQVSDTQGFPAASAISAVVVTKTGVPEGPDGRTSFTVEEDLRLSTRYYWRSRAEQGGIVSDWSSTARFRTKDNGPPIIKTLTTSRSRVDADEEITVTAVVEDAETPVDQLIFNWSSAKGSFVGTGSQVKWKAPHGDKPGLYELKLTVIERYTLTDTDGSTVQKENRATGTASVRYNDSYKEIRDLTETFLGDFSDTSVSPESCVRNFSDSCGGKRDELEDIRDNRATRVILSSSFRVSDIRFNGDMTYANISAPCEFTSRIRATGKTEVAKGTCILTSVYEDWNWFLCDSNFKGTTTSGLHFIF